MIYHAGLTTEIVLAYSKINPGKKLKVLMSFGRRGSVENASLLFDHRNLIDSVICDSGTWTLNQNPIKYKNSISYEGYESYLKNLAAKFDFYFNYDENFTTQGFETNLWYQQQLEEKGLQPVPVIHDCYCDEEVNYYIDNGYEIVAIGSGELQSASVTELARIVEKFYRNGIKVHFLGCTNFEKLAYTQVYSCDSSSWVQGPNRGYILYWNPEKPGINKTDAIDFETNEYGRAYYKDYAFRWELEEYLESELGFEPDELVGPIGIKKRQLANTHFFVGLEERIAENHRELGYRW